MKTTSLTLRVATLNLKKTMTNKPVAVYLGHGYGGRIKMEAVVDGIRYIIEREYVIALLEDMILEKGYTAYKKKHQVIPRLEIKK